MFFESLEELGRLVEAAQTVILSIAEGTPVRDGIFSLESFVKEKKAYLIDPADDGLEKTPKPNKNAISVAQIRFISEKSMTKKQTQTYFVIKDAEKMTEEAANAFLKLLEEPLLNYHFILQTNAPDLILATIRSRAVLYAPRVRNPLEKPVLASNEVKELARELILAKPARIAEITTSVSKKKNARNLMLEILGASIEMCYKSYFKTGKTGYIRKIPALTAAYEGVKRNGNMKLQVFANLV